MKIRLAKQEDKFGIHQSHMESIRKVCAKDYSPEQIKAWGHRDFHPNKRTKLIESESVWVLEEDGKIYGHSEIGQTDDGQAYIYGLYFLPEAIGKGFGKKMLNLMESKAKSWGCAQIKLHSTITALTFYEKFGYAQICGADQVILGGVELPCFGMVKEI